MDAHDGLHALPNEADVDAGLAPVRELGDRIAGMFPLVRRELQRLEPPPKALGGARLVSPPPLVRLTLAVAGAAMCKAGIHYVHLYSRETDLRPEIFRMALDRVGEANELRLRILTNRLGAIRVAAQSVRPTTETVKRTRVIRRTGQLFEDFPQNSASLVLIDLDHLHKETEFSAIRRLWIVHDGNPIVLFGSRDHPILRDFIREFPRQSSWTAWGVNREQILNVDAAQNHLALHAIKELSPGSIDPDNLPERLSDLRFESVVPPQYRKSSTVSGRFWTTVAAAYSIRDAERRKVARREVVEVAEIIPKEFSDARRELEALSQSSAVASASPRVAHWLDDLWYVYSLPPRITVPMANYIKEIQAGSFFQGSPLDLLSEIKSGTEAPSRDSMTMSRLHTIAQALTNGYDAILTEDQHSRGVRLSKLLGLLQQSIDEQKRAFVLALNAIDKRATEKYLRRWASQEARIPDSGSSTQNALVRAGVTVLDPRELVGDATFERGFVSRYPSPSSLDMVVTSSVRDVTFIVHDDERKRILYDVYRDVVRERRVYSPTIQSLSLARLGLFSTGARLPDAFHVAPSIPAEIEKIVDEVGKQRENRALTKELDLDALTAQIAESGSDGPRDSDHPFIVPVRNDGGWLIRFDDGSEELLGQDDALHVVNLESGDIVPHLINQAKIGMCVIVTQDNASSAKFSAAIVSVVLRLRPQLSTDVALDGYWRETLQNYRLKRKISRATVFSHAQACGFSNETALSILFYERRNVWLPRRKENLRALLKMLDADVPGVLARTEDIWNASGRLRTIATGVLSHVKKRAAEGQVNLFEVLPGDEEIDPLVVPSLGLRASHIDGLFVTKKIVSVTPPAGFTPEVLS